MKTRTLPFAVVALLALPATAFADALPWVGTWGAAPMPLNAVPYAGHTLRQTLHTSVGGEHLRLRLSNQFGDHPLTLTDVHVALSTTGSSIDAANRPREV